MELWTKVEAALDRWDVLEHPFYRRWTAGALTREELAVYAAQYRHAVQALADASAAAATVAPAEGRPALERHAREEKAHVALWDDFAAAVGARADAEATHETRALAAEWTAGGSLPEHLVALYAIESRQPQIAAVKRAGLVEHYGVAPGPGTAYFDLHATLDLEHAAAARAELDAARGDTPATALVARAEAVSRAYWELLDGVERVVAG